MINFVKDEIVTTEAFFLYDENKINDLTILFLTNSTDSFQNTEIIVNAIVFESAFIIINQSSQEIVLNLHIETVRIEILIKI